MKICSNRLSMFKTDGRTESECDVSEVGTVFTGGTVSHTIHGGI